MTWQESLFKRLNEDPGVSALVASRIFPEVAPDNTPVPFLVYQLISGTTNLAQDGDAGLDECTLQITAWGATAGEVSAIRKAVRSCLQSAVLGGEVAGPLNATGQTNLRDDRYHAAILSLTFFTNSTP